MKIITLSLQNCLVLKRRNQFNIKWWKIKHSVEREEKIEEESKGYIHRESRFTSMARNIYLTEAYDEKEISARLNDGVLEIIVPKKEQEKNANRIEIK